MELEEWRRQTILRIVEYAERAEPGDRDAQIRFIQKWTAQIAPDLAAYAADIIAARQAEEKPWGFV